MRSDIQSYNGFPQSIGGKVDGAQSVDSRHNGSFLEPTEGCRTPTRCPNSPARLQRRSSTQDSVTGGDGMQLPAQDSEGGSPARSSFNSRDSSRSPLRGSNSPLSPLSRRGPRSSLKWGVTQLLDNKLSHYLLPGAESPAVKYRSTSCC